MNIQFTEYGQAEYWVFGHVVCKDYVNGFEIDVADGSRWTVTDTGTINRLVVADGVTVCGEITENDDGTITITLSENIVPADEYGFYEPEEAVST